MIKYHFLLFFTLLSLSLNAQLSIGELTLNQAISIAQMKSPQAQMVELSFMARHWNFRAYKAQLLPSLNLNSGLGQYNRSIVEVRDPVSGEISYVANNTLSNDLSLSIDQNIALTGGRISLNTNLARLDQFTYSNKIYNSTPLTLNYIQPLRAFNDLKWQKRIEPMAYENAKRQYLESIENITIQTTSLFFSVLSAQNEYDKAVSNYNDTKKLYEIAQKRAEIGTITKSELLQLELSLLNSDLYINNSRVNLDMRMFNFASFLGVAENSYTKLIPPMDTPNLVIQYDHVLDKAINNSTHKLNQEIKTINANKAVARAKANRGIQLDLHANLGFSQSANTFGGAYSTLKDREVVGLALRLPIYDWGMSKGRVKMAQAEERLALTEVAQEEIKFEQDIKIKVLQFNNQAKQCYISKKALEIAFERYDITKNRFQNGSITVTDLNTAQKEKDDAQNQYISQLRIYWECYYEIQKLSLYDYITNSDISIDFDKIIEK